jgi:hypothetical protein
MTVAQNPPRKLGTPSCDRRTIGPDISTREILER